jgi:hypothetical protein
MKPARVADEIVVESDEGFRLRMKNAEEVVGLAEGELRVAESGHGRERGGLSLSEGSDGFVASEEGVERGNVDV